MAIALGLPHGGWCPRGRRAEDGTIPARHILTETPGASYLQRTEWNVRDSDGTVVFTLGKAAAGGSRKTIAIARAMGKPCLHLARDAGGDAVALQGFQSGIRKAPNSSNSPEFWRSFSGTPPRAQRLTALAQE